MKMIFFLIFFYLLMMSLFFWYLSIMFLINKFKFFIEFMIMNMNSLKIEYIIYIDWMTLMFMSTVLLISSLVVIYSVSYMSDDLNIKRFMFLILIFILSMMFLILSPNMISILLGWDGLGLSSYCLVAYYSSKKSFNSSMVTILMNRVGDIMIIMLISMFLIYGSWNYMFFNKLNFYFMLIVLIASMTKSAQIPFSSWLPMAMAAPTPVSSLVHSSTLVTVGVYLLIRFNFLFNNNLNYLMMMISSLTMFMAGMSAINEFDIKKIIALSTLSQLGLMIFTISLNLTKLSFFHLITHAMFKSLLFLCSGIMIHFFFNYQDIRFISIFNNNLPFISMTFNIATLTLCGLPFLSGFYSKDLIIEMFLMMKFNWFIYFIIYLSMMFTILYSFRLMYYVSLKQIMFLELFKYNSLNLMNYSILLLLLLSIFYGSILNWILFSSLNKIFLMLSMKLMIYYFLIFGMFLGLFMSKKIIINYMFYNIYLFLNFMWYFSNLFKFNKNKILKFNNYLILISDNFWLEYLSFNKLLFMMNLILNKKKYYLNFILMLFLMIYLIIMMFFIM